LVTQTLANYIELGNQCITEVGKMSQCEMHFECNVCFNKQNRTKYYTYNYSCIAIHNIKLKLGAKNKFPHQKDERVWQRKN
jgi:hypothetical protein